MASHLYAIGEQVAFQPGRLDGAVPRGTYTVVRRLPSETPDHQYRVRNTTDNHERVVRESQLRRC